MLLGISCVLIPTRLERRVFSAEQPGIAGQCDTAENELIFWQNHTKQHDQVLKDALTHTEQAIQEAEAAALGHSESNRPRLQSYIDYVWSNSGIICRICRLIL